MFLGQVPGNSGLHCVVDMVEHGGRCNQAVVQNSSAACLVAAADCSRLWCHRSAASITVAHLNQR
jgi:hypothetical protein